MQSSPQESWQKFKEQNIPKLSRRRRWLAGCFTSLILFVCMLIVLPFLLPLAGPDPRNPHALADPNGAFITLDDYQIYYVHLPADGETVLLLHGLGGSTLTWRETLPALQAAGFNTYALDLPGAGLSEKGLELDYSHPAMTQLIVAFLDRQNIARGHIVAHAVSGNIALMLAQVHSQRVSSLTLVAPTIITDAPPKTPSILLDLPFLIRWIRVASHYLVPEIVGDQLRSATVQDDVVTDDLIQNYSRVLYTEDWDLAAVGMLRDSYRNALSEPLSTIEIPVLLLWGAADGWASPEGANNLVGEFPDGQLHKFPNVGHLPMHEAPMAFNTVLINFLDNRAESLQE